MTKDEKSLLLYLETRAVDHSGVVNIQHMNEGDMKIAERWNKSGFVEFGRIAFKYLNSLRGSHYVHLSAKAWEAVAALRQERAERTWNKREWLTAKEKNGAPVEQLTA